MVDEFIVFPAMVLLLSSHLLVESGANCWETGMSVMFVVFLRLQLTSFIDFKQAKVALQ